jgi:hypothetical protein
MLDQFDFGRSANTLLQDVPNVVREEAILRLLENANISIEKLYEKHVGELPDKSLEYKKGWNAAISEIDIDIPSEYSIKE